MLIVFLDAAIFFLFSGWGSLVGAVLVFTVLTFYFYRDKLLRSEWRMSMVVATNLFINNYAIIWPYTSYGLLRLEYARVQNDFVGHSNAELQLPVHLVSLVARHRAPAGIHPDVHIDIAHQPQGARARTVAVRQEQASGQVGPHGA